MKRGLVGAAVGQRQGEFIRRGRSRAPQEGGQPNERTGDFCKKVAASDMQLAATRNNAAKNALKIGFAVNKKMTLNPKAMGPASRWSE